MAKRLRMLTGALEILARSHSLKKLARSKMATKPMMIAMPMRAYW
jgi:hypothetical protein